MVDDFLFDPLDEQWWAAGTQLAWWDSALANRPAWLPGEVDARRFLMRDRDRMLRVLGLAHSMRTVTTGQLHALDNGLPSKGTAGLYLSMASVGLLDLGFPIPVDGRIGVAPRFAPFTAVRLPAHRTLTPSDVIPYGLNPVEAASIGPAPWRGTRQYDRHNLICSQLAIVLRAQGYGTAGDGWGRFDLMTHDPLAGRGGPDLELFGQHLTCIELTASTNIQLEAKFRRWDRILAHDGMQDTHVVWLAAGRGDNTAILKRLTNGCTERARQHAADTRDWLQGNLTTHDGYTPQPPTTHPDPGGWMHDTMRTLGQRLGFPNADNWRLTTRLEGRWLG